MTFPQKPARRYTNPRMGARAAMQERQEEGRPCLACNDSGEVQDLGSGHFVPCESCAAPPDSTVFPTEAQVEAAAAAVKAQQPWWDVQEDEYAICIRLAKAVLAVVAPLVNGIADQRDASYAREEKLCRDNELLMERAETLREDLELATARRAELADSLMEMGKQRDTATEVNRRNCAEMREALGLPKDATTGEMQTTARKLVAELARAKNGARWLSERLESAVKREEKLTAALSAVRAELEAAREKLEREQGLAAVLRRERDSSREVNRRMVSKLAAAQRDRDAALADAGKLSGTIREQAAELASLREELAAEKQLAMRVAEERCHAQEQLARTGSLPDNAAGPITAESLYRAAAVPVEPPADLYQDDDNFHEQAGRAAAPGVGPQSETADARNNPVVPVAPTAATVEEVEPVVEEVRKPPLSTGLSLYDAVYGDEVEPPPPIKVAARGPLPRRPAPPVVGEGAEPRFKIGDRIGWCNSNNDALTGSGVIIAFDENDWPEVDTDGSGEGGHWVNPNICTLRPAPSVSPTEEKP